MKKPLILTVLLLFCMSCVLSGCQDTLFVTAGYRQLKQLHARWESGQPLTKDSVWNALGCPDSFGAGEPRPSRLDDPKAAAFDPDTLRWIYERSKYPDPADPYRLIVTFNGAGQVQTLTFAPIPGG